MDTNKWLMNHLMKNIFTNKVAPAHKEYRLVKEPATFQDVNNMAGALWRKKYPEGGLPLKPKFVFATESKFGFKKTLSHLKKKRSHLSVPLGITETEEAVADQTQDFPITTAIMEMVTKSSPSHRRTKRKRTAHTLQSNVSSATKQETHKLSAEQGKSKRYR